MKVATLINKLEKMQIAYNVITVNNYNYELEMIINNKKYYADYDVNINNKVNGFYRVNGYNEANQTNDYYFYSNINRIFEKENLI